MASVNGSEGLDGLFSLTKRKRTVALADLLDKHGMRNPATVRFALAGVVTAMDSELVQNVARLVAHYLKAKAIKMED